MNTFLVAVSGDTTHKAVTTAALGSGVASFATADWAMAIFGVPAAVLFAGFAGAAIALRFVPELSRWGMFGSVGSGTIISGYSADAFMSAAKNFGFSFGLLFCGFAIGLLSNAVLSFFFKHGGDLFVKWRSDK
jgi:hypothetical protein